MRLTDVADILSIVVGDVTLVRLFLNIDRYVIGIKFRFLSFFPISMR